VHGTRPLRESIEVLTIAVVKDKVNMAKKKSKSGVDSVDAKRVVADAVPVEKDDEPKGDTLAASTEEEELELLQVDLGDILKVKQVLDEATASAMLDLCNLEEDYRLENIKLILMFVACCFAMVAQFAPLSFPESRYVLGGCCVIYFVLSGFLQLLVTFVEKDAIMITKPESGGSYEIKDKGIRVRTSFPRFEEFYCVVLEYEGVSNSRFVEHKWSVGNFFDVEGMFDEISFMEEVQKLVKRFEKQDYDKEEKKDEQPKAKKE
jgi:signal peptidase complex subunit 2